MSELIDRLRRLVVRIELGDDFNSSDAGEDLRKAIAALEAVPAWASGQTLAEDDLCDWLTEHAWDASEDSDPVYVVDKEALQGLFKNTILVLAPPTTQSDGV